MTNVHLLDMFQAATDEIREFVRHSTEGIYTWRELATMETLLAPYSKELYTAFRKGNLYTCEDVKGTPLALMHYMTLSRNIMCMKCVQTSSSETIDFIEKTFPFRCDVCLKRSDEPLSRIYGSVYVIAIMGRACKSCLTRAENETD